jgi:hypothetical protein
MIPSALLTGAAILVANLPPLERAEAHTRITTNVTWSEDIRPIFIQRCMPCHHPGGLAPDYVDLTMYGTDTRPGARAWAAKIEDEVMLGLMPPWNPDERFGSFSNSRSLTKDEKDLIIAWIRGGGPQGPLRNLPPPAEFANSDWTLGQPDVIVGLPQGHVVPSDQRFDSAEATVALKIEKDTYITGYEFLVGDPQNVASVTAWLRDPEGFEPQPIEVEITGEYDPFAPDAKRIETRLRAMPRGPHFLGQWVKGDGPVLFPDAAGRRLYAGSSVELRVEYVRPEWADSSKEIRDNTRLGLFLAKPTEEIDLLVESKRVEAPPFSVAAGIKEEHQVEFTLDENAHLLGVEPHLGPTATRFKMQLFYPDGLDRTLVWVPKYEQRWASSYRFGTPIAAPAGTKMVLTGFFDNTADNSANPNSPPADVKTGPGFLDERLYAYLHYTPDDHLKLQPVPVITQTPQGGGMLGGTATTSLTPPGVGPAIQDTTAQVAAALETSQEPERIRIASNGYHQVQGMMTRPGAFALYVYNDRMESIDPRNFSGELLIEGGARRVALVHYAAGDDFLSAWLDPVFPQSFEARLLLGGTEEKFAFKFDAPSPRAQGPGGDTGKAPFVQPPHGGWLQAIEGTAYQVEAALPETGDLRLYFYGPQMTPVDPRNFHGGVETIPADSQSPHSKMNFSQPTPRAEYLQAKIPPELPQKIHVSLAVGDGRREMEFEFSELSEAPWDATGDSAKAKPLILGPHGSPELYPSADGFHFVEAALPRPGEFRLYFYDGWKNSVDPGLFSAEIEVDGNKLPLTRLSQSDDFQVAFLHPQTPMRVKAAVWIGGKRETFAFNFDDVTVDPATRANTGLAHMDHTPLHGGQFFMADNLFHHVEGAMPGPGEFRVYFYDDYKRPIDPRNFSGTARIEHLNDKTGEVTEDVFPLEVQPGADYLKAIVPGTMPATLYALVKLGGADKRFDFQFHEITVDTGGAKPMTAMSGVGPAGAAPGLATQHSHYRPPFVIPGTVAEILAAIEAKQEDLRRRIAAKDWYTLYQPAFDLRDLVGALTKLDTGVDARQLGRIKILFGTLNRTTNRIDRAGDTTDIPRVQATFDEIEGSLRDLRSIFPAKK